LLGYWADETKGYRLEDAETGKLITSRDVRFLEDERPTDLAVIEGSPKGTARMGELMEIQPDGSLIPVMPAPENPPTVSSQEPAASNETKPAPTPEPPVPANEPEPVAAPAPDPNVSVPRAPRNNKWADLPRREQPTRAHNAPARYQGGSSEQEVDTAIHKKNQHQAFIHQAFVAYTEDPNTYAEAMASPYSKEWEKALRDEVKQLEDTGTIKWMNEKDVPEDRSLIDSRIVWKTKRDGAGAISKHKGRIVARGFSQIPGEDYTETFASTARFTTFRALMSLAAREDWEIHQFDVTGAYLKGDLEEEIYMEVPKGVDLKGRKGVVWKLQKPIYGLKQAGRQWKKKLDTTMAELGFDKSAADDNLYILHNAEGEVSMVVLAYVDDTIPAGPDLSRIVKFKKDFSERLEITDLGDLHYILGIRVTRD
jgi:hypothetical protein